MSAPLYSLARGGFTEVCHRGEVVVVDATGVIYQSSELRGVYPVRSLLKPFQFFAAGHEPNAIWAPAVGSISATEAQVAQIRRWHPAIPAEMVVPASYPMEETFRAALKISQQNPSPYFHTCFSKHMAILKACEIEGWDLKSYAQTNHPYHERLLNLMGTLLGDASRVKGWVTDGCGLPSPVLDIRDTAELYRQLAVSENLEPIRKMMIENPTWVGGDGRVDTTVMQLNSGKVILKDGADGLLGVGVLPCAKYPSGLGIMIKLDSGYLLAALGIVMARVAEAIGLEMGAIRLRGHELNYHFELFKNSEKSVIDISPLIHEGSGVFPGDIPFRRQVSLDSQKGQHLTLSSMETTLHIGAHVDAPNHFGGKLGIDKVSLNPYQGPCQVIRVVKKTNEVIMPEDIAFHDIRSSRILIQTLSYDPSKPYQEDFVALASETIRALKQRGVILVGVDTPSIDPCHSKDLPAHHAALSSEIAILEGIDLSGIKPGVFELSAMPLRIQDGDASPVRAVLGKVGV